MRPALARSIVEAVDPELRSRWLATLTQQHDNGATMQSWLWAAPAKHSTRQIEEVLERIQVLTTWGVDRHLAQLPGAIVRRYARRLGARAPAIAARIAEPASTIEVACFLRYCLLTTTDHLLLDEQGSLAANPSLSSDAMREPLLALLHHHCGDGCSRCPTHCGSCWRPIRKH